MKPVSRFRDPSFDGSEWRHRNTAVANIALKQPPTKGPGYPWQTYRKYQTNRGQLFDFQPKATLYLPFRRSKCLQRLSVQNLQCR